MGKQRFPVTQVLKNMDGTDALVATRTNERCEACGQFRLETVPFTLRTALVQCLTGEALDPRGQAIRAPGPIRYQRMKLALRIDAAKDTIRLTTKQINDIETLGRFLTSHAMYQVWNILGLEEDEDEEEDGEDDDDAV